RRQITGPSSTPAKPVSSTTSRAAASRTLSPGSAPPPMVNQAPGPAGSLGSRPFISSRRSAGSNSRTRAVSLSRMAAAWAMDAAPGRAAGGLPGPVHDPPLEHGPRHRAGGQPKGVEAAQGEPCAHLRLRRLARAQPGELADHVAAGLARPDAVAFDLGGRRAGRRAVDAGHGLDRLFAAPAL